MIGKNPPVALPEICAEDAQATDENRHLGRGRGQQLRPIHQQLLRRHALLTADIVAETVSGRFERREGYKSRGAGCRLPYPRRLFGAGARR
jgi:hypothetical protein